MTDLQLVAIVSLLLSIQAAIWKQINWSYAFSVGGTFAMIVSMILR